MLFKTKLPVALKGINSSKLFDNNKSKFTNKLKEKTNIKRKN